MRYLILLLLLLAMPAYAGSIQFTFGGPPTALTTTAAQDTKLQAFVDRFNLTYDPDQDNNMCAADPDDTCHTIATYLSARSQDRIDGLMAQESGEQANEACVSYVALTATDKASIRALLGGKSPCK